MVVSMLLRVVSFCLKIALAIGVILLTVPLIFLTHPHALLATIIQENAIVNRTSEPEDYGLPGRNFYLESSNGLLPIWHLKTPVANRSKNRTKLMVYIHGTTYSRIPRRAAYEPFLRLGFDLIVPELPGFHEAAGPFTGSAAVADLRLLHHWLASHYKMEQIVWWCFSMGAGTCLQALPELEPKPGGLILEAPFFSMRSMLMSRTEFYALTGWLLRLTDEILSKFENKYGMRLENGNNLLRLTDTPVLHIMSRDDGTISYNSHFPRISDPVKRQLVAKIRRANYIPVTLPACRGLKHYPISSGTAKDVQQIVDRFWEEVNWPGRYINSTGAKRGTGGKMKRIVIDEEEEYDDEEYVSIYQ